MVDQDEPRRAAAICEHCETVHSVRIGPSGDVRPIGTGRGSRCTCGEDDFRVLSEDADLIDDVEAERSESVD